MVDLATAKAHLRVEPDDVAEDSLITGWIAAAVDHFQSVGVTVEPMAPAVKQAVLMLVAHFFMYREPASDVKAVAAALGIDRLIQPYREIHL